MASTLAGCGALSDLLRPGTPTGGGEWEALLVEIRGFERAIGFSPTTNFADVAKDQAAFPFCGHTSRRALPWSYEDPAIRWSDASSESACRERAPDDDVYYRKLEAKGESSTPVTSAMLAGKLDRFIYLVIHEDCHDQFALPFGVEEALCDFITHKAMTTFAEQKYPAISRERLAILNYAERQATMARATIDWYARIEVLYGRFQRGEIALDALLFERAGLFAAAERPLGFARGELNNVSLASNMTYSRYYPLIDDAFEANGRDLARTVAFLRKIDAAKPQTATVQKQQRIADAQSGEFLRAYESAIIDGVRAALRAKNPLY